MADKSATDKNEFHTSIYSFKALFKTITSTRNIQISFPTTSDSDEEEADEPAAAEEVAAPTGSVATILPELGLTRRA